MDPGMAVFWYRGLHPGERAIPFRKRKMRPMPLEGHGICGPRSFKGHLGRNSAKRLIAYREELPVHLNRCLISLTPSEQKLSLGQHLLQAFCSALTAGSILRSTERQKTRLANHSRQLVLATRIVILHSRTRHAYPELVLLASFAQRRIPTGPNAF